MNLHISVNRRTGVLALGIAIIATVIFGVMGACNPDDGSSTWRPMTSSATK